MEQIGLKWTENGPKGIKVDQTSLKWTTTDRTRLKWTEVSQNGQDLSGLKYYANVAQQECDNKKYYALIIKY